MAMIDTLKPSMFSDTGRLDRAYRVHRFAVSSERSRHLSSTSSSDSYSFFSAMSRRPSVIELVVSKLLDAFIFASALAITTYNYWTGNLDKPSQCRLTQSSPVSLPPPRPQGRAVAWNEKDMVKQQEHMRRQRTFEWAEALRQHSLKEAPMPSLANTERRKRRSRSFDSPSKPVKPHRHANKNDNRQEDDMMARMEEQVQSLIQQGQAALTSTVDIIETDEEDVMQISAFEFAKRNSM